MFENFNLVTFILWDSVHKNFHSIIHITWSHKMENRRKLQLRLNVDMILYVLYNDYSCVFTVKDESLISNLLEWCLIVSWDLNLF